MSGNRERRIVRCVYIYRTNVCLDIVRDIIDI